MSRQGDSQIALNNDIMALSSLRILVVGQTPPPFGGQAVMIQKMLDGQYEKLRLFHVRMNFSDEMDDIGRFQLKKLWRLVSIVAKIFACRFSEHPEVLYYPPAGPNRVPFLRDAIILTVVRPFFRRTIFHFHASGLGEFREKLSWFERRLFELAYSNPDMTMRLSSLAPPDHLAVRSKQDVIIPNGIEDLAPASPQRADHDSIRILFVGVVCEEKGAFILVDACHQLAERGLRLSCEVVGRVESQDFEAKFQKRISSGPARESFSLSGVLTGQAKLAAFERADIFCFPTHFKSETLPLVIIEAMQFSLPVVSTVWKAIPDLVVDGENGFLVPTHSSEAVAEKLHMLAVDETLRVRMGKRGRESFLKNFQVNIFHKRIEKALLNL